MHYFGMIPLGTGLELERGSPTVVMYIIPPVETFRDHIIDNCQNTTRSIYVPFGDNTRDGGPLQCCLV